MDEKKQGWLNIYKPVGISSFSTIYKIKKKFNIKKIGHAGTLDPNAEGILPIAINKTTKLIPFVSANSKKYKFLREQNFNLWKDVQSEDLNIIEGMQEGRKSPSYNGGNFSPVMDNATHHFHKWVANNLMK